MIGKILVLFFIAAAFGNPLKEVTPEEAKKYFDFVFYQAYGYYQLAGKEIRARQIPLITYTQRADAAIYDDLKDAASSYWEAIKNLENAAEQKGQDISTCVNAGHEKLYQLNNTVALALSEGINSYLLLGWKILDSSGDEASKPFLELDVLKELVAKCDNTACATYLNEKSRDFLERARAVYKDAEERTNNYTLEYILDLLAQYKLDKESYQAQSNAILSDVQSCVNNL